jgi:response regulator RpfG family c-di-GMP phosphodiesterase
MKTSTKQDTILVIDEQAPMISRVGKSLVTNDSYDVLHASNLVQGWELLLRRKPDLVIIDPATSKWALADFYRSMKKIPQLASTSILLLVDHMKEWTDEDPEISCDDYVEKSIPLRMLHRKIRSLLRIKSIQAELESRNNELNRMNGILDKNIEERLALLIHVLDICMPGTRDRSGLAKEAAGYVSGGLSLPETEKKNVIIGAVLHEIGKVGLPRELLTKKSGGLSARERQDYQQHPVIGSMLVSTVAGLEEPARYIYSQLENFDGSGCPDKLMKEEIPVGSRILRAINLFEELSKTGLSDEERVQNIHLASNKLLDPRVSFFFVDFLVIRGRDFNSERRKVPIDQLLPGMIVAEDVYTCSGIKLLPKQIRLQQHMITVLAERNQFDAIPGGIYIRNSIDTPSDQ